MGEWLGSPTSHVDSRKCVARRVGDENDVPFHFIGESPRFKHGATVAS